MAVFDECGPIKNKHAQGFHKADGIRRFKWG